MIQILPTLAPLPPGAAPVTPAADPSVETEFLKFFAGLQQNGPEPLPEASADPAMIEEGEHPPDQPEAEAGAEVPDPPESLFVPAVTIALPLPVAATLPTAGALLEVAEAPTSAVGLPAAPLAASRPDEGLQTPPSSAAPAWPAAPSGRVSLPLAPLAKPARDEVTVAVATEGAPAPVTLTAPQAAATAGRPIEDEVPSTGGAQIAALPAPPQTGPAPGGAQIAAMPAPLRTGPAPDAAPPRAAARIEALPNGPAPPTLAASAADRPDPAPVPLPAPAVADPANPSPLSPDGLVVVDPDPQTRDAGPATLAAKAPAGPVSPAPPPRLAAGVTAVSVTDAAPATKATVRAAEHPGGAIASVVAPAPNPLPHPVPRRSDPGLVAPSRAEWRIRASSAAEAAPVAAFVPSGAEAVQALSPGAGGDPPAPQPPPDGSAAATAEIAERPAAPDLEKAPEAAEVPPAEPAPSDPAQDLPKTPEQSASQGAAAIAPPGPAGAAPVAGVDAGPGPHAGDPPALRSEDPAQPPITVQLTQALRTVEPGVTELRLSPEDLGSVRIELRTDGDRATLVLSAERQDTQDLMRRQADRLMADLRDAGFIRLDLSFGRWSGEGQAQQQTPAPGPEAPPAQRPALAEITPARPLAQPAGGGLYLRI